MVNRLQSCVAPVTRLRLRNASENWGLAFDEVDLSTKIDQRDLTLKKLAYCSAIQRSSRGNIEFAIISATADDAALDDGLGARGKDVIAAAGVALRRVAGNLQLAATSESVLSAQVHSSSGLALANSEWLANLRAKLSDPRVRKVKSRSLV